MILDFHTHVFPKSFRDDRCGLLSADSAFKILYESPSSKLAGAGDLVRSMDEASIQKSVIFGFPWEKEAQYKPHNDYILECVNQYPDRLIGFGCFSLLSSNAAAEAERCLSAGLSGVGELAVYSSGLTLEVIGSLNETMFVCRQHNSPVLFHVNEPVGHVYPGKAPMTLFQIYELLKTYPYNKIVLAHWGGGIFFYALMKKEVREVLKNVWVDTAASPYLYHPDIYRTAVEIMGKEKILLGSDYPLLRPQRYLDEMVSAGLSQDAMDRIAGLNAKELLGK